MRLDTYDFEEIAKNVQKFLESKNINEIEEEVTFKI